MINLGVTYKVHDLLFFVDIETTGLRPTKDITLEVGFRVTSLDLETINESSWLISPSSASYLEEIELDPFIWKMHNQKGSGLIADVLNAGLAKDRVRMEMHEWLTYMGVSKEDPLCGSSVGFDRSFLKEDFPEIEALFSYRNIDVSTMKELCKRYNPELYSKLEAQVIPRKMHRVRPDIDDTANEMRFYHDNFLFIP